MLRNEQILPLNEAQKIIFDFFKGDDKLVNIFNKVAEHINSLDSEIVVRARTSIIGMSRPSEHYRFYVVETEGAFYIKYKNWPIGKPFTESAIEEYYASNMSCNEFFTENLEYLSKKTRKSRHDESIIAEWDEIKSKVVVVFAQEDNEIVEDASLATVVEDIFNLLEETCNRLDHQSELQREVLLSRCVKNEKTLQEIGDEYGISRERVRQIQKKTWKYFVLDVYSSAGQIYAELREKLIEILTKIPENQILSVLFGINKANECIWNLLETVCVPDEYKKRCKSLFDKLEHQNVEVHSTKTTSNTPVKEKFSEASKVRYAQMFMDKLAHGINPLDNTLIPENEVAANERMSKCFSYVSSVLSKYAESLDNPRKSKHKLPFAINAEIISQITPSEVPITIKEIVAFLNSKIDAKTMQKLTVRAVNNGLLNMGALETTLLYGKLVNLPTARGNQLGFYIEERHFYNKSSFRILLDINAQQFVFDNINSIVASQKTHLIQTKR